MIQTFNNKAVANGKTFVIAIVRDPTHFVLAKVGRAGSRFLRIWQYEAPGMARLGELHWQQ
ncbi:MAG: hypothetical protein PHS32_17730 [Rhodoferax sp.]|uniref:hypothetical protein n=1 Tax=Rhodoferax sp. TaxID=50421 RepID=UPI00261DDC3D|nr:hypothetical protein [Rhodoferax sp.]MDD5335576.1 hypothetical protein [Rhodoferax sp.]